MGIWCVCCGWTLYQYVCCGRMLEQYVPSGSMLDQYVYFGSMLYQYVCCGSMLHQYVCCGSMLDLYVYFGCMRDHCICCRSMLYRYVYCGCMLYQYFFLGCMLDKYVCCGSMLDQYVYFGCILDQYALMWVYALSIRLLWVYALPTNTNRYQAKREGLEIFFSNTLKINQKTQLAVWGYSPVTRYIPSQNWACDRSHSVLWILGLIVPRFELYKQSLRWTSCKMKSVRSRDASEGVAFWYFTAKLNSQLDHPIHANPKNMCCLSFGVPGLGLGFGIWGLGFGVQVLGFRLQGLGCKPVVAWSAVRLLQRGTPKCIFLQTPMSELIRILLYKLSDTPIY